MTATTITRAQHKGLRHYLGQAMRTLRALSAELYAAHGGWHGAHEARMASFLTTRG